MKHMLRLLQAISTESLDPHCLGLLYLWREKIENKESYCQCTSSSKLIMIQMNPMCQE